MRAQCRLMVEEESAAAALHFQAAGDAGGSEKAGNVDPDPRRLARNHANSIVGLPICRIGEVGIGLEVLGGLGDFNATDEKTQAPDNAFGDNLVKTVRRKYF